MSRSPTYVSRLDPQFRRFVNVVNVYPSSETSASNDDLSKDGVASLASSSCSEINQEFISVDAYTEENWPPPQSSQRQVSELYLEYANVLSSESETSFGNDNDIGIVTSPNLREDSQNLSNSEQHCSPDRIRNDGFGDDSVFWSDGHDEIFHEGNGINQCLQERPGASNKRPTLNRPQVGSFSSEADSESSYRYCKDTEGRLEHFEDNEGYFSGRNTQWSQNTSPVSMQPVQEVIARRPLNTSRKMADSLDELSSLDSELGYAPDVIEDGYSSTSSADSSFVCFALVGNQDDKRTKRKMASKNGRGERYKKHRYSEGDLSRRREIDDRGSDPGLMACIVTGISGGPAIRVYRDEDSHRLTKSKSRPLEFACEDIQPNLGRTKGGSTNSDALSGSKLLNERSRTNSRESVFALFASPEYPLVKKKQIDTGERKWDTEQMDPHSPQGADCGKGVLPGFPEKYTSSKPRGNKKEPPAIKSASKEIVQSDVLSKQLSSEIRRDSPSWSPDERQPVPYVARQKQMPGVNEDGKDQRSFDSTNDSLTKRIMYENVQRKAVPVKLQSTKIEVSSKASRKSSSKGQRSERNQQQEVKDATKPAVYVTELKLQDTKKISQGTDLTWPPKEQDWAKRRFEYGNDGRDGILSEPDRDGEMVHHSLPLESESVKAFDPYKQQQDSQKTGNFELKTEHPREEEDTGTKAKTELLTPVRQAIQKTIQTCFSDNDVNDDSSNEEYQVCPEIHREGPFGTESESCLDLVEETEGLQTNSANILSKDDILEEIIKEGREVPNIESVDTIGTPKLDRLVFEAREVDSIDLQTEGSCDTDSQPVEDSCDDLQAANRHSKDDISLPSSPVLIPVTKRKHAEDERQEVIHSKKTKSRLEISPKAVELPSELSGDMPGPNKAYEPHSLRSLVNVTESPFDESDSTIEIETRESTSKRHSVTKTEGRIEHYLEEGRSRECPSSDNILRPSKEHQNVDNDDDDDGNDDFSLVPGLKEKRDGFSVPGIPRETFEEQIDTIATNKQDNQICHEDDEREISRKPRSAVDVHGQSIGNMKDERNKSHLPKADRRRHGESVSLLSSSPLTQKITNTHVAKRTSPNDNKQETHRSKGSKSHLEAGTNKTSDDSPDFNIAEEAQSRRKSSDKISLHLAKAFEYPRSSLDAVEPSDNVTKPKRDLFAEEKPSTKQTSVEDRSEVNADSSTSNFKRNGETCETQSNALVHKDKDVTLVPKLPEDESQDSTNTPNGRFDTKWHNRNEMYTEETQEISSTHLKKKGKFIGRDQGVKRKDVSLEQNEQKGPKMVDAISELVHKDSKTDNISPGDSLNNNSESALGDTDSSSPIQLNSDITFTSSREIVEGSSSRPPDIDSTTNSTDECDVLFYETKFTSVHKESFVYEKPIEYSTQMPSASTILPNTVTPRVEKVLCVSSCEKDVDPCEVVARTDLVADKNLHHMPVTIDTPHSVSGFSRHQDTDDTSPEAVQEAVEYCIEKHGVNEDICFVAFDVNESPSEDGALDTTGEEGTADVSRGDTALTNNTIKHTLSTNEIYTFVTDSEMDSSSENALSKVIASDNVLVLYEREKIGNEVKEVVCSYEEQDLGLLSKTDETKPSYSENSFSMSLEETYGANWEGDAQGNMWASTGSFQVGTRVDVHEKTALNITETNTVKSTDMKDLVDGQSSHSFTQPEIEEATPSKTEGKRSSADAHGMISCKKSAHCDCLQRYFLQDSHREEERDFRKESVTSAETQTLDMHFNVEATEDITERFGTFRAEGFHSGFVVQEVSDQQCQVDLIKECGIPPECKNRGSQTSFSYCSIHKTGQTNDTVEVNLAQKALQQQTVECQTELQTNVLASVGVQVKFPDYLSQDKLKEVNECWKSSEAKQVRQEEKFLYTDKGCQTTPDCEQILSTSKQCQTAPDGDESSLFLTDHDAVMKDGFKSSHHVSLESKEYQTSGNEFQAFRDSGNYSKDFGSVVLVSWANKECQTSGGMTLVTSSVQCEILPTLDGEDGLSSYDKECQTFLDKDLLYAASKECQTSSWLYTSQEIAKCAEKTEISYVSKECQTFIDNELLHADSKGCQTLWPNISEENAKEISYLNKECQTFLDNDLLHASSKECQTFSWSYASEENAKETEKTEMFYASTECQTMTDISLPLTSSKESQTTPAFVTDDTKFQARVAFDTKESQTEPYPTNDDAHLSVALFQSTQADLCVQKMDSTDVHDELKDYETKESQTTPDSELIMTSSKLCQTSNVESVNDYQNKESQTLCSSDMFLASSKESQTVPYSLDDLKLLVDQMKCSQDVELFNDAEAEQFSRPSGSPQIGPLHGASRPSTYGKSPEVAEISSFEFKAYGDTNDTTQYQTSTELASNPLDFALPVDVAEIGCQAVLCHCGHFVDEHENGNCCPMVSSDPQNRAAMRVSEGMQKEQASLIKQLDMLRDMNQKLRDDKDAIEAAHEAKKTKVSRQGSQMSKYVKKRRAPAPGDTWGNQGTVESLSGDDVDGPDDRRSVSLPNSIQEEAEFDGDPTLELISDEKAQEMERPAWAKKIISCVQPKEIVEDEENQLKASDEELEEDVFRRRKVELISGAARGRLKEVREESDMSLSEDFSDENGSASDNRPSSPRAAPVGKDNEMCRTVSQDMSEAGVSTVSEVSTPERVFKVVFVGDSGVGKSSFIHRFCHDAWKPSFTATIGVDFQIKTMNLDGRCIALQLWDTAGQERFRSITKQYFRKADGVIVFYDVTMETSFLNIKNWMISVEEGTDDGTAIMIVGNKTDLLEEDSERPVKTQDGKKLAEEYKAMYTETSAKTGYNIQESMAEFSKMLQVREDELMQSVLNLVNEQPNKKKCCK